MVFSFFKKQSQKMPERQAAKPRPLTPEVIPPKPQEVEPEPLSTPLPDLEFTTSSSAPAKAARETTNDSAAEKTDINFSADDFDGDFTESSVMGIDVEHGGDAIQSDIEHVVVLFANGQDAAARSLLESFVQSYQGVEGKRFWFLLFDLLQAIGDRAAFEKLSADFVEACEMSPPPWRLEVPTLVKKAGNGEKLFVLQGVLTAEGAQPVADLAALVSQKLPLRVDCGKLVGCDDAVAGELAELLSRARRSGVALTLNEITPFIERLSERLVAGDTSRQSSWLLLLELLQRHGTQETFEEKAVDYAVTFELSPPSWEKLSAPVVKPVANVVPQDSAHYFSGELKNCRFDELLKPLETEEQPVLDFSGVRRMDFFSAGQLVNRIAPFKAKGKDVVIRSPNHLIAELMAVVGLNKQARIVVPKS